MTAGLAERAAKQPERGEQVRYDGKRWERMVKITLTPDIERALLEQARKRGTTVERLALESLHEQFVAETGGVAASATLADFLGGHLGVLHSSGEGPDTKTDGGTFAGALLEKRRLGRL
jgi:hypothetical protein